MAQVTPVKKEEVKQQTIKVSKPAIAGLPMDETSDAWMNDDVGTIVSDSEEEEAKIQIPLVQKDEVEKEKENISKSAIASLPMDEASDAWMNDDVGTMDSESEDEEAKTEVISIQKEDVKKDVGTIDSYSDDKEANTELTPVQKEKGKQQPSEVSKPAIAGLPMNDASDAWMNEDFGTIDSDDEDSIQSLEKEKKIIVEKIEVFKEKLTAKAPGYGFTGLPINELTDAWMNDDFVEIEDDEEYDEKDKFAVGSSKVTNCTCYSPLCNSLPGGNCYSPSCNNLTLSEDKPDSFADYDETDKETQIYAVSPTFKEEKVKEGRLSAIDEAKRFSCDDDEDIQFSETAEIVKEVTVCDDDESTSWAFVAYKEPTKSEEKVLEVQKKVSGSPNPALIVEIIEKEQKSETMDPDGYKVVKGKTKTRDKRKNKDMVETNIEAIISELDQPIETEKESLHTEVMSTTWMDDFEIVENKVKIDTSSSIEVIQMEDTEKGSNSTTTVENMNVTYEDFDDPWLAVKTEYAWKESSSNNNIKQEDNSGYTIEVKVSTKETCLGRRLHEQQEADWKMDVQCIQKHTMPDIIEGHEGRTIKNSSKMKVHQENSESKVTETKFNSLPRLKSKAESTDELCLSPSWMRKDFSRTQSVESNIGSEGGIFGSVKERKLNDSRTSCFTSSAETLDDNDDDVYWRLKHKVKKKKRRNQSGPSDAKSRENNELLFSSTNDLLEPLNAAVEPIFETKEESLATNIPDATVISTSSINTILEIEQETTETIDAHQTNISTAQASIEKPKISLSQNVIPNEKLLSMEMDLLRKESISPVQIDQESAISVSSETVAESNMKCDFQKDFQNVKTCVADEEMHLANVPKIDIKRDETKSMAPPSIVLQNESESKMAEATEIIRASSPRAEQNRPHFKRQNSKEMQQAVEVQRPLSFERQKTLSVSIPTDTGMDENDVTLDDEEIDKGMDEQKKRSSLSFITAKVVSKKGEKKDEKNNKKSSKRKSQNLSTEADYDVLMVDQKAESQIVNIKVGENSIPDTKNRINIEQRKSYA